MNMKAIEPFGVIVDSNTHRGLSEVDCSLVKRLISQHRIAILRGFNSPSDEDMLAFCKQMGTILEWEFGAVNELQVRDQAKNYLYTYSEVPFHWDGAFVGKVPHYIFFHCKAGSLNTGGETTFCDTTRLLKHVPADELKQWKNVSITYQTEKVVHYGGSFTSPMLSAHPVSGETVLRFAEPVNDLNPVRLTIEGIPANEQAAFLKTMHERLNDPGVCYAHDWQTGDIVLADNHALLHGRKALTKATTRHLRRVNIL